MKKTFLNKENFFLAVTTVIFFVIALKYFLSNAVFIYDGSAHLAAVWYLKNYLWPAFSGWNPFTLLGYDQGFFYPSLFHWLAASLSFLFSIETSVKLLIGFSLTILPLSIFLFFRKFSKDFETAALATSLSLTAFLFLPSYLGANLAGLFYVGLLTSIFSLPFLFFYLASLFNLEKGKWVVPSLLLSALILLHIVAAEVAVLVLVALIFNSLYRRNFQRAFLWHILTSLALTSFFWIPFVLNPSFLSLSQHPPSLGSVNLILLFFSTSAFLLVILKRKKNLLLISLALVVLCSLTVLDFVSEKFLFGSKLFEKLYTFHLYRLQSYEYLLGSFFLATLILIPKNKLVKGAPLVLALTLIILDVLYLVKVNPFPNPTIPVPETTQQGRFIESYTQSQNNYYQYTLPTSLVTQRKVPWAYGLFTDGTPNGPYLGSLVLSLSGQNPKQSGEESIEKEVLDKSLIKKRLALFGINNVLLLNRQDGLQVAKIDFQGEKNFTLQKVNSSTLVSTPADLEIVDRDWDKKVGFWWTDTQGTEILVKTKNGLSKENFQIDKEARVSLVEHNQTWSAFTIDIAAKEKTPVLVKFTYLPSWHAYKNGQEVTIYQASPDLMLVNETGKIDFIYKELPEQTFSKGISILALLSLGLILVRKRWVKYLA